MSVFMISCEGLHRLLGVERIAVEIKALNLILFGLIVESGRGRYRVGSREDSGLIVFGLFLFRPGRLHVAGLLGIGDGIGRGWRP